MHPAAALDIELRDRRADLGNDSCLLQREQNRVGRNRALEAGLFDGGYLNRDLGLLGLFLRATERGQQGSDD
jgi:hypothetical protein